MNSFGIFTVGLLTIASAQADALAPIPNVILDYFRKFQAELAHAGLPPGQEGKECDPEPTVPETSPFCIERRKYLEARIATRKVPDDFLSDLIAKDTDVVQIGEHHSNDKVIDAYPDLIERIQKIRPKTDCLFLETEDTYQKYIDRFMKKGKDYEQIIVKEMNRHRDRIVMAAATESLLLAARRLHIEVFAVDMPYQGESTSQEAIDARNAHMSKKIHTLFKKGRCHQGIQITGETHLTAQYKTQDNGSIDSIPTRLKKAGLKTATFIGVQAGARWDYWNEDRCVWNPPTLGEASYGFRNPSPAPAFRPDIDYGVYPPEHWDVVDGTLVFE